MTTRCKFPIKKSRVDSWLHLIILISVIQIIFSSFIMVINTIKNERLNDKEN